LTSLFFFAFFQFNKRNKLPEAAYFHLKGKGKKFTLEQATDTRGGGGSSYSTMSSSVSLIPSIAEVKNQVGQGETRLTQFKRSLYVSKTLSRR
jgi:hypothetical protein